MKLYDYAPAPNPRRVNIFLAEKGIAVERVAIDMTKGEHKSPEFLNVYPAGKLPVLELDDGTIISESMAICRYFDALHPEPNLFGVSPAEIGHIEMRNRQMELELLGQVGASWVNGPIVGKMDPSRVQFPAVKEQSDATVNRYYKRMDRDLAESDYIAGPRFTVADITALAVIDFAANLVRLKPAEELQNLWAWHKRVSARPSANA